MNRFKEIPFWRDMWNTPDRRIASVSLILGIISIAFSLFTSGGAIPTFIVVRDLLIVSSFGILIGILLARYLRREVEVVRLQTLLNGDNAMFNVAQNMVGNYKDVMFEKYYDPETMINVVEMDEDDDRAFKAVANHVTIGVRDAIKSHLVVRGVGTDENISVAIKSLVPTASILERYQLSDYDRNRIASKTEWLVTSYRDPDTYNRFRRDRETNSAGYDVSKNSAFKLTLEDGKDYYLENDLEKLGQNYQNENPNWRKFYNATVAVPIRYRREDLGVDKYYGVLAVDSLNRSKVDLFDTDCVTILRHAADILSVFFLLLELLYDDEPAE